MLIKRLIFYILLFFFGSYLVFTFAWINLDSETLAPWVQHQINLRLPKRLISQIGAVSTSFNKLSIDRIDVVDSVTNENLLHIQSLNLSFSFLKLALFQALDYQLTVYGGLVEGSLKVRTPRTIQFKTSNLEFNSNTTIRKSNLILSNPTLAAEGVLTINDTLTGKINFDIKGLLLTGESKYTEMPFELPQSKIDTIDGELLIKENQTELNAKTKGDINASISGKIDINRNIPIKSEFELIVKASFTPEYETRLGFLNDVLASYRDPSEKISIRLTGNLDRPKINKLAE